jgi:hypothetical protein
MRSVGRPTWPFPVVDMIEVKLRTRSGCSIARIVQTSEPDSPTAFRSDFRLSLRCPVGGAWGDVGSADVADHRTAMAWRPNDRRRPSVGTTPERLVWPLVHPSWAAVV